MVEWILNSFFFLYTEILGEVRRKKKNEFVLYPSAYVKKKKKERIDFLFRGCNLTEMVKSLLLQISDLGLEPPTRMGKKSF